MMVTLAYKLSSRSTSLTMSHRHQSSVDSLTSVLTFTSEQYSELFDGPLSLAELVRNAQLLIGEHHTALVAASDKYRLHDLLLGMMEHAMDADGKRYVAVVLHIASRDGAEGMVRVAQAWMHHLFYPSQFDHAFWDLH